VIADTVARTVVERRIADTVQDRLAATVFGPTASVTADVGGVSMLAQLATQSFGAIEVAVTVPVEQLAAVAAERTTADDGGLLSGATWTTHDGALVIAAAGGQSGSGPGISLVLQPTVDDGDLVLVPTAIQLGDRTVSAELIAARGGVGAELLSPWPIQLPELPDGIRLVNADAADGSLVLHAELRDPELSDRTAADVLPNSPDAHRTRGEEL